MWGCVKSLVHSDRPETIDALEDNIRCLIAEKTTQITAENERKLVSWHQPHRLQAQLEAYWIMITIILNYFLFLLEKHITLYFLDV